MRVDMTFFWKNRICFELSRRIVKYTIFYKMILLLRHGKHKILTINGKNANIYFAPQWHALSGEFVSYMLETLEKNPQILTYFKHSFAPDEMLIPTLLFNSKFSKNAVEFLEGTHYNEMAVTHFINYGSQVEVFDECRYHDIIASGKMFMRKVTSNKSETLLDMVDEYRNHDDVRVL